MKIKVRTGLGALPDEDSKKQSKRTWVGGLWKVPKRGEDPMGSSENRSLKVIQCHNLEIISQNTRGESQGTEGKLKLGLSLVEVKKPPMDSCARRQPGGVSTPKWGSSSGAIPRGVHCAPVMFLDMLSLINFFEKSWHLWE